MSEQWIPLSRKWPKECERVILRIDGGLVGIYVGVDYWYKPPNKKRHFAWFNSSAGKLAALFAIFGYEFPKHWRIQSLDCSSRCK